MRDASHDQPPSPVIDEIHAREASASAAGYYFQALYALIILLRESNEDAEAVTLENLDDIHFSGNRPSLFQVKYSRTAKRTLTIASEQLWKTLANWSTLARRKITHHRLILVTSASIGDDNVLAVLMGNGSRKALLNALEQEAQRVVDENTQDSKKLTARAPLCREFLRLSQKERKHLIARIHLASERATIATLNEHAAKHLHLIEKKYRFSIAKRLLEWWALRAAQSLTPEKPEPITKAEVTQQISALLREMSTGTLPGDFEDAAPPEDINALKQAAGVLVQQIQLVRRGDGYTNRAVIARWKARMQREAWVNEGLTDWNEQGRFDLRLIETWKFQFEPACDNCEGGTEDEKIAVGREVLDWALRQAPDEQRISGASWNSSYMTRGVLQQLADEKKVGWHPDYEARLKEKP
ncbi:ABC-three component system protein [Archangium gephyra]|uniref:ABC-three component system protein n=1 Tax=Archangium gephyra TaxID=48 RepID=UPI003B78CE5D